MKSNVSDYLKLVRCIYIDACARCPADVSDLRDLKTIESRVKAEGISFLTITLPRFCSAFEAALQNRSIDSSWKASLFRGFPFHGAIPAFLQGMLSLVFDQENGRIYDESTSTNVDDHSLLIDCVRQICLTFKKLELDCTPERVHRAIANFVEIESSFDSSQATSEDTEEFLSVSSLLWDNLIYSLCFVEFVPRHGPGATAERISGNGKYVWRSWFKRLDNYFPLFDYAYISSAVDSEEVELVTIVPETSEYPVRVTPVPKTLKGPRIIAIEPCCMQYAQQGIRSLLYSAIESYWLTARHINFRDQSVNQSLAIKGSKTGRLATIDLSDASDRVPRDLALEMFRGFPELKEAIDACRSTHAQLPDGRIIGPLKKFASMGSALCFPVESMYFYTICVAALLRKYHLPLTQRNIFRVSRRIHIYGDDIIVPTDAVDVVYDYLQKYRCKVNSSKSFSRGNFRESCGVDAYAGKSVTPIYLRRQRPLHKRHCAELVSWSATANLFSKKGFWRTAEFMHSVCESILGYYPEVSETSQALGRIYSVGTRRRMRFRISSRRRNHYAQLWGDKTLPPVSWNEYQRPEVMAWVPSPVYRTDKLDGYAALQKSLLRLSHPVRDDEGSYASLEERAKVEFTTPSDPLHLERSALYGAVTLKLRWVPAT